MDYLTKKNEKMVIIAGSILCINSVIKIINSFIFLFRPLRLSSMTAADKLSYLFVNISPLIYSMLLGICGFMLVYEYLMRDKNTDMQNRFFNREKIVFLLFIIFTVISIFKTISLSLSSVITYQILMDNGSGQEIVFLIIFDILGIVFGLFITIGSVLFGLYILSMKEKFRKPGLILYLTGIAYSFCSMIYFFIKTMIFNIGNPDNPALYGASTNMIYENILSFLLRILVLACSLIIVLYGMKKIGPEFGCRRDGVDFRCGKRFIV